MDLLVSMPDWATAAESQIFVAGMGAAILIGITRACLRWFRAVGHSGHGSVE